MLPEDVLLKQGGKLAFYLSRGLKKFMPGKGVVTEERLAALKAGEGIFVRPAVYRSVYAKYGARTNVDTRRTVFGRGKRGRRSDAKGRNLQALAVARELGARESGRGFISFAARFGGLKGLKPNARMHYRSRYGNYLASVGLATTPRNGVLAFSWGGGRMSSEVAQVMRQPRVQAEVARAIRITADDIRKYTHRKTREDARKAFR